MRENRLYHDLAYLWPIVSPPEEHAAEAGHWCQILEDKLGPGWHPILELGVGGGHNLFHLAGQFPATAVDISQKMLDLSKQLNPTVEHHLGDMRSIRLGRMFKAVLIHDAINYMLTEEDLRAAFATARAHLESGGVLIVAPDWFTETFVGTTVLHWIRQSGDMKVTFIEYLHQPDPRDTTLESLFFFIINQNGQTRIEQDRHVTGLFPMETWFRLLRAAGFKTERVTFPAYQGGYGGNLLVGVLP